MENQVQKRKNFTITKKIAKHGNQAIIIVPRVLESRLKPGTVVKVDIDVIDEATNLVKEKTEVDNES